jgi:hypothetical protein
MDDDFSHIVLFMLFFLWLSDGVSIAVSVFVISLLCRQISFARVSVVSTVRESLITLFLDTLSLSVLEVRSSTEHPRNADESEEEKNDLNERLSSVKLFRGIDLQNRQC